MRFPSVIGLVGAVVVVLASCGDARCPGRPGVDWVEGQVVVRFAGTIRTNAAATEFLEARGLTVASFIDAGTITAIANTAPDEECTTIQVLGAEPEVDTATLRYLARPAS